MRRGGRRADRLLWFRVGRGTADAGADAALVHVVAGRIVVTLDRGDYWQCAFVIPKGSAARLRARSLAAFRAEAVEAAPLLAARIGDDVQLLCVAVDRLVRCSKPGLLCIGDAAHAMSSVGGVGINLAIRDAVAAVNLLAAKLRAGPVDEADLDAVRRRRLWPTKATQALQVRVHDEVLLPAIAAAHADGAMALPLPLPLRVVAVPALRRALARLLGLGLRPEHVDSPLG